MSSLIKHHAMKTYERMEVQLHAFLISAEDGSKWSASRLGRFLTAEKDPLAPIIQEAKWAPEPV
jgi:hypothetical protein